MVIRPRMARPSGTSVSPAATVRCAGRPVISWPSSRTRPACGRTRPVSAERIEVFPAPFGPISVTICPSATRSETPRTASTCP